MQSKYHQHYQYLIVFILFFFFTDWQHLISFMLGKLQTRKKISIFLWKDLTIPFNQKKNNNARFKSLFWILQRSLMKFFAKIVKGLLPFTISSKRFHHIWNRVIRVIHRILIDGFFLVAIFQFDIKWPPISGSFYGKKLNKNRIQTQPIM